MEQFQVDQGMYEKGYRWKLIPLDSDIKPLFTKEIHQVGPLMREWGDVHFTIIPLRKDWEVKELLDMWPKNSKGVVHILGQDHPGLTAMFMLTGIQQKVLNVSDANMLVNELIDLRQSEMLQ